MRVPFLDAFSVIVGYTWYTPNLKCYLFSNCSKFFQKLKLAAN